MGVRSSLRSTLRKAGERYSRLEGPIDRIWNTYEHVWFTSHVVRNAYRYRKEAAPVDPYRVIHVDPALVERLSPGGFHFLSDGGKVVGGDWDTSETDRIEESFKYESFQKHFFQGVPWDETEFYRRKVARIESDRRSKYETVTALERKCETFDATFEDIRENGYRSQEELVDDGVTGWLGDGGTPILVPAEKSAVRHEVAIDIARDGEAMLNEGRHRLYMVKLLDLESIPVRVIVRHRTWQDLRNAVADQCPHPPDAAGFEHGPSEAVEERLDEAVLGLDHPDLRWVLEERR